MTTHEQFCWIAGKIFYAGYETYPLAFTLPEREICKECRDEMYAATVTWLHQHAFLVRSYSNGDQYHLTDIGYAALVQALLIATRSRGGNHLPLDSDSVAGIGEYTLLMGLVPSVYGASNALDAVRKAAAVDFSCDRNEEKPRYSIRVR